MSEEQFEKKFAADPVEVLTLVRRALRIAQKSGNTELEAHARSIMSVLVYQLTNRFVLFPPECRGSYEVLKQATQ